jgi:hypothetical protein
MSRWMLVEIILLVLCFIFCMYVQYAVIVLPFYSRNGYTNVATGVENIMLYIIRILYEAVYFGL